MKAADFHALIAAARIAPGDVLIVLPDGTTATVRGVRLRDDDLIIHITRPREAT